MKEKNPQPRRKHVQNFFKILKFVSILVCTFNILKIITVYSLSILNLYKTALCISATKHPFLQIIKYVLNFAQPRIDFCLQRKTGKAEYREIDKMQKRENVFFITFWPPHLGHIYLTIFTVYTSTLHYVRTIG